MRKALHSISLLLLAAVLTLNASCEAEQQYSRKYGCNFIFFTQHYPTSSLSKIDEGNLGAFVNVKVDKKNGLNYIYVTDNNGGEDAPIALTNAIENERISYDNMGANKSLFIGCSKLNGLKAYDGQCPYCLDNHTSTKFPLTWVKNNNEKVECKTCHRQYNLNNEGLSDDGQRMLQYRVMTGTGYDQTKILRVTN